jgi:hypothetical protein
MDWISDNWIIISLAVLFIAMYFFGHKNRRENSQENEGHGHKKTGKSGHSCCH